MQNFGDRAYQLIRKIPKGKVATYGQIAALLGKPRGARQVGWALHQLKDDSSAPWHRVINADGCIRTSQLTDDPDLQRKMLESEGVVFDGNGRVDLSKYGWKGDFKGVAGGSGSSRKAVGSK